MLGKIKEKYNEFMSFKEKKNIVKLTKLSIFMVIILDIFVYISLIKGIDFQTKVINNPNTKYSQDCRDNIKSGDLDRNILFSFKNFNNYKFNKDNISNNTYGSYEEIENLELDTRCKILNEKIEKVKNSGITQHYINTNRTLNNNLANVNKEVYDLEKNYSTVLLEKIANQDTKDGIIESKVNNLNTKAKYDNLISQRKTLEDNIAKNFEDFENDTMVIDLVKFAKTNKTILDDYEKEMKYYKIKVSLISILFSLPLVVLFFTLMRRSNNNGSYAKYIVNKNLFIVSLSPFISNFISLVYNIIPNAFIKLLIGIFYSINIPFVVYYILIGIFVIMITFVIIKIQNNKQKEINNTKISFIEFYNKDKCFNCGCKVSYIYMNYCPNCNNQLKDKCSACGSDKIIGFNNCYNCGKNTKE